MNIARNFINTAQRVPDKPFLIGSDDSEITYRKMYSLARKFASMLRDEGVEPNDRVIITFPNSVEYFICYLGALFNSCTALLVDFRTRPQHLDYFRTNGEVKRWITPKQRPEYQDIPGQLLFPENLESYSELAEEELCATDNPIALIMYTSGSTGVPKGVCLSHDNLQHTIKSITSWANIDEDDRELTTLSLTHLFGLAHVHIYWTNGGTVYIKEKLQRIPKLLQQLTDWKITSFPGTPGGFKMILDQHQDQFREHGKNLKYIIINSAPMSPEYVQKMLDTLPNTKIYMYYGLTEASRSSYICYNDHRDKLATVGRPSPGASIIIGTPDKSIINETGEILINGPHVTEGYLGIDSSEYFDDGWLKTGDSGCMDDDGFITWEGRIKEQINIDGLKLTPMEVEEILMEHERVKDCAIVGAPDPLTGESIAGFVVVEGESDKKLEIELRKFCKGKLEVYKIPKQIIFIDEIPRTDSGKTKRMQLKEKLSGEKK
ncbi:MAG: acyl--CoA ligase [candidate division Zixibacteria bacterium]|nr:acyl--CoA ligase [candidate division Zixibacteria bacterium]